MIARPELLADLAAEIEHELREGCFIVTDVDSAAALSAAGLGAVCSARMADVLRDASRCMAQGAPALLVNSTDGELRNYLVENVPGIEVRDVPLPRGVASVAGMLGYAHGDEWDVATATAKSRTWLEYVAGTGRTSHAASDKPAGFPVDALPPVLRAMVVEGAAAQGVDVAHWAVPALGIVSGCIGATRRIRLSRDYVEPAVLWTANIAPSGSGKTPGLRALLRPVRDVDYSLHERTVALQQAHEAEGEGEGQRAPAPPMLAALVDDVTLEGLVARLSDNPRGLLLAVDELAGWVRSFDRYRKGGDAQQWLQIHGADAVKCDRKGTGGASSRIYVRHAAVSIAGTIQPGIARRYLGSAEATAAGLTARLLVAQPQIAAAVWTDREVPQDVHEDYGRMVRSLLDLSHDDDNPKTLRVTKDALAEFIRYHDENGAACVDAARDGEESLAAALSKLRGAAPRIALDVALARAAEAGTAELLDVVGVEDMGAGIAIASWFEGEARRLYANWSTADADDRAGEERGTLAALADKLYDVLGTGQKAMRDLHAATGRNLDAARLRAALALLRASGRAEPVPVTDRRPGRPSESWRRVCA